jgi:type IV secretory pathway VirB10-like protein
MEPREEPVTTEIAEEPPATPAKKREKSWLLIGIVVVLLISALAIFIVAVRWTKDDLVGPSREDLEQQRYDAEQRQKDDRKAAQLRNDPFLVRKEDESQRQLNSLLNDLNLGKDPGSDFPIPLTDRQAKAEEEAIAGVLREPVQARSYSGPPQRPRRTHTQAVPETGATEPASMFVYSRTFGAARYVDAPPKNPVSRPAASAEQPGSTSLTAAKPLSSPAESKPVEQRTTVIYTELPPVTLYEGEILEAVLVNRIIADTEPSPVLCHLTKDVFDRGAKYVVLPASSRVVGVSQVVNYKGAHRLFISFHRIILPNGPSIDLPAGLKALKALDETGALGVVSKVERHWFLQFGTAIFFGVLDGLAGAVQRNRDIFSTRSIILGRTSESFDRILENIMAQYSTIVPTIRVDQGKTMKIHLAEDILISPFAKISDRSYYANR